MIIYFYLSLFLFPQIFIFTSVLSLTNTTFYLLDKDHFYNENELYLESCLDNLVDCVSCTILRRDIINNLSINRCYLFRLVDFRRDLCYYLNFSGSSLHKHISTDSFTILYPYFPNFAVNTSSDVDSYDDEFGHNSTLPTYSLMELESDFGFEKCMIMTNEICRVNERFSRSLDSLIKGDRFSVLSILARKSPVADKINYNLLKDLDVYVPTPNKFHNYILSSITDQFYIHKNDMLKKLEYSLKFRECVLLNELDLLFFNITQFPLNLYRELMLIKYSVYIMMLNVYIMDGYNHLTYVTFTKLQGIIFNKLWSEIEKSDLQEISKLIERFLRVYDLFQKELKAPLKFTIDPLVYGEILSLSSSYSNFYSKHLESNKTKLSRLEIDKLITDSNEFLRKLSILLSRQCQPPSTYGPQSTSVFFKSSENKINSM